MRTKDMAMLVSLAAIWGASYLFIHVAVDALGPFVVALVRVIIGTLGLAIYARLVGKSGELPRLNKPFLVLGLANAAIPYGLIAFAELHLTASLAGILNATTPLFTALVVAVWDSRRPPLSMFAGMALGLLGVGVLVGWNPSPFSGWLVISVVAMLVASLAYGFATAYAKRALHGVTSLGAAAGQQMAAAVWLIPFGIGTVASGNSDTSPSLKVVLSVLALGLLCTSLAYLLYFHLIASVGAVNTSAVTFLIPVFGILWSALFLGEAIHAAMVIGLVLILSSVSLVTGARLPFRRPSQPNAVAAKP